MALLNFSAMSLSSGVCGLRKRSRRVGSLRKLSSRSATTLASSTLKLVECISNLATTSDSGFSPFATLSRMRIAASRSEP